MPGFDTQSITHLILSFFGIIAFILIAAVLLKRSHWFKKNMGGHIKIVSSLPLGTREKLLLLQVGSKQLLVGMSSSNIQTLHVFDQNEFQHSLRQAMEEQ